MGEEREGVSTGPTDTERRVKEYCEQLCAHKFDTRDEMVQFLESFNLLKFLQGEVDHLNRPISIKEIESINNLSKQKAPGPCGLTGGFYQTIKEEIFYNPYRK